MALFRAIIRAHMVCHAVTPCRFYFLGDDDLLEVLGQGASLSVIQPHLKKLFAGIHRVRRAWGQPPVCAGQLAACGGFVEMPHGWLLSGLVPGLAVVWSKPQKSG
jgi:hypothetical protein